MARQPGLQAPLRLHRHPTRPVRHGFQALAQLGGWLSDMVHRLRRDDKESYICYVLFIAAFVADFSVLALAFPLVLFCYGLLANPPPRKFWQVHQCPGTQQQLAHVYWHFFPWQMWRWTVAAGYLC